MAPAIEAALTPEPEPEAPPAEAPRCAEHPDQLAPVTCARCGRYCCRACVPDPRAEPNCPACQRRLRVEQNPQQLARLRRELRVSFFFAALVIGALGLGLPLLVGSGRTDWIALGAIFSLGQVGVAAGFLVLPRSGLAWAAVAIELIASLSLVAAAGPSLVTLVLLAFPFFTVFRIFKWRSRPRPARSPRAPDALSSFVSCCR